MGVNIDNVHPQQQLGKWLDTSEGISLILSHINTITIQLIWLMIKKVIIKKRLYGYPTINNYMPFY